MIWATAILRQVFEGFGYFHRVPEAAGSGGFEANSSATPHRLNSLSSGIENGYPAAFAQTRRDRVPKETRHMPLKHMGSLSSPTTRQICRILLITVTLFAAVPFGVCQAANDWITGMPRQDLHVKSWPDGRKVAVCFVLYVEVWGRGQGPNFRPDLNGRKPDIVDEAFRQYAINWGLPRVARLFHELKVPLSLALNAQFLEQQPSVWKTLREFVPQAPVIAHGLNNSTDLLPLAKGQEAQRAYIRQTVDMIQSRTGVRSFGWSSPSVYPNADTYAATAAEGVRYSLDGMDSDVISRLDTPSGPLWLIPYPPTVVDMGQYLSRFKEATDLERLWLDYVGELIREAKARPDGDATIVAIGIHPFVAGTPAGAAAMRRVLNALQKERLVWLTDVEAALQAAKAAHGGS
jgi:peptidoglycan/xylan/chitin deacetylase (PgdA/CDA1 family)